MLWAVVIVVALVGGAVWWQVATATRLDADVVVIGEALDRQVAGEVLGVLGGQRSGASALTGVEVVGRPTDSHPFPDGAVLTDPEERFDLVVVATAEVCQRGESWRVEPDGAGGIAATLVLLGSSCDDVAALHGLGLTFEGRLPERVAVGVEQQR